MRRIDAIWVPLFLLTRRVKHNNTLHNFLELRDQLLVARRRDDDVNTRTLGDEPREARLDAVAPALRDAN